MDTEHGFLGNLKAGWARIQRFFRPEIIPRKRRLGMESQDGTIWDVLHCILGEEATAGFTLFQFTKDFGLVPLVGKMVAYCGEAELKGSHEKNRILEVLKGIIGEDTFNIPRKFKDGLDLALPTRLMIACNELPTFYETTGALSARLLLLKFNRSFVGREDYALKGKLRAELPGIANWSLEGLRRLRANGRFTIPKVTQEAVNEFKRDNSPALAFVQDRLMVENRLNPGNLVGVLLTDNPLSATKRRIEGAYRAWCQEADLELDETQWNWFWRRMKTILPKMKDNGKRGDDRAYIGIAIKEAMDGAA